MHHSRHSRRGGNVVAVFLLLIISTNAAPDHSNAACCEAQPRSSCCISWHRTPPPITHGEEAPKGRFPYLCSLRTIGGDRHVCAGTLIHPLWVLTAAHCVQPSIYDTHEPLPVIHCGGGDLDSDDPSHVFRAIKSKLHESWNHDIYHGYDVALLKLDREAPFPTAKLDINGDSIEFGDVLAMTGWGLVNQGDTPGPLMISRHIHYEPRENCEATYERHGDDHWLCARMYGADASEGESGGPVLRVDAPDWNVTAGDSNLDLVVGMSSFQYKSNGRIGLAGLFTSMSFFADWINCTITVELATMAEKSRMTEEMFRKRMVADRLAVLRDLSKDDLNLEMAKAITRDDSVVVKAALLEGLEVNGVYYNKQVQSAIARASTWMHWAAFYNAIKSAEILLAKGANVDAADSLGNTPLLVASFRGKAELVELLIDHGADVDYSIHGGDTPLVYASKYGYLDVVKILLEHGADVNLTDRYMYSALHGAALFGRLEVIKVLVAAGASKTIRTEGGQLAMDMICDAVQCTTAEYTEITKLLTPGNREEVGHRPSHYWFEKGFMLARV